MEPIKGLLFLTVGQTSRGHTSKIILNHKNGRKGVKEEEEEEEEEEEAMS